MSLLDITEYTSPFMSYSITPYITEYNCPNLFIKDPFPSQELLDNLKNKISNTNTQKTEPRIYEHRYLKSNIDVVIRGTYDDVMATVTVLNQYPPKVIEDKDGNKIYDCYFSGNESKYNVPKIGVQRYGKHIRVRIKDKIYSGSGIILFVCIKDKPITEGKFVLFKSTANEQYEGLGGKIDEQEVKDDILYENAKKETKEESMNLIDLNVKSKLYVDIESDDNKTYYRSFLYPIYIEDYNNISNMYNKNMIDVIDFKQNYNDSYRETNKVDFFDYETFKNKLNYYDVDKYNKSNGVFQTTNGDMVNVRGRTLKVINKMIEHINKLKKDDIRQCIVNTFNNTIKIQ